MNLVAVEGIGGFGLIIAGVACYDWRLALIVAGAGLLVGGLYSKMGGG